MIRVSVFIIYNFVIHNALTIKREAMSYLTPISELVDDKTHGLLEPPSVAFSNITVRRAFIVWMYCGQKNRFKDVCNYFHYLEALEEKLPAEGRASSRNHEFDLFSNQPPKSTYLTHNFPKLYTDSQLQQHIAKVESSRHDACVFKLQEFDRIAQKSGTSRNEIVEVSIMIRNYCKTHMTTLERFLKEFKEHTERCGLTNTVGNVALYIKRKIIQSDIELEANYAMTLELLTKNDPAVKSVSQSTNIQVQCNTDRIKSGILKDGNSQNSVSSVTLIDKKCTEDKAADLFNSNTHEDIFCKYHSIVKSNHQGKENMTKTISEDFLDDPFDCGEIDVSKFRTRRFSGSNFIKKDVLKCRKI